MDKNKKNRSGSLSNNNKGQEGRGEAQQVNQPGGKQTSNRQSEGHRKDDSSRGAERNTTKKQENSI